MGISTSTPPQTMLVQDSGQSGQQRVQGAVRSLH
jgi:hypothetical protein